MTTTPKAWIGCLGCYNEGRLVGDWVDGQEAGAVTVEKLHSASTYPYDEVSPHEELWVMDHEGYGQFLTGECSPMDAQRIADLMAEIESDGYEVAAVAAWMDHEGREIVEWDAPTRDEFTDAYCGEYETDEDYAQQLAEDLDYLSERNLTWPFTHIDWQAAAEELFSTDNYSTPAPGGGVYVFRNS